MALKVLLVEDDRLVASTLVMGLGDAGCEVAAAGNAPAALEVLREQGFDIAVVDLQLGKGGSGFDVGGTLKERQIPFVVLTAYNDAASIERATAAGAMGYLIKPIDVTQLVPALHAARERHLELQGLRETERQLQSALAESRDVSVAVGILMERRHLARDQAFQCLRQFARSNRRRVVDVAGELVGALERLNLTQH